MCDSADVQIASGKVAKLPRSLGTAAGSLKAVVDGGASTALDQYHRGNHA